MHDQAEIRPVPRWVRVSAITTLILSAVLLALGGFVTSFRAGMADPVWPTEPWYLASHFKLDLAYLIEHIHRIAGWIVGLSVTVLAFGAWWYESRVILKWSGIVAIFLLLVSYGEFHRGMGRVWMEWKERAAQEYQLDPKAADFEAKIGDLHLADRASNWPVASGVATGLFATVVTVLALFALRDRLSGLARATASWALIFVMVQGLLGGFRVFLNALMGTNLAAMHGAFGQVTFCMLIAVVVFMATRREGDVLDEPIRSKVIPLAWGVVALLLIQLVWAVMLRHTGTALSQRLHILTAFCATATIVWLAVLLVMSPSAKAFRGQGIHLLFILGVQLLLGVEAYLGKFASVGANALTLPELRPITVSEASIRTLHQLIGAGLLGSAVAVAIRLSRRSLSPANLNLQKSHSVATEMMTVP